MYPHLRYQLRQLLQILPELETQNTRIPQIVDYVLI
jgi:hypothetical protein